MAPVDGSPANNMGGFELICSLKSNDVIPVYKYRSTNTGLNVFIAEIEGPVVSGFYCLATEAHDDGGLPHTLEHLIFLGSEQYPYKGVLDLVANRCLASGTNAHTDTDNTIYTMENVGSEGFLTLMPMYLEHILYPTLELSGFLTEVHHITSEGEDAGVVYCEMQTRSSEGETLAYFEMLRAAYPGKCGYKSNTGGELKELREFTTLKKVRDFHKEFYRPENLSIIITGQVKHTDVFKALQPLEENIMKKGNRGPFTRPWQSPVPPFTETTEVTVLYPCNDEDNGLVFIGWRGPPAAAGHYDLTACSLLLKYLTDTASSPLQKNFVEIDDPYASNVTYSLIENASSLLHLVFENVPKEKISDIGSHLMKILQEVANENGIDMQRMRTVIHRHKLETMSNLESKPHDAVAYMIIGDILFGNTKEDLATRLNEIEIFEKLKLEPVSYWLDILKKYFIAAPRAVIKGIPSIAKHEELTAKEKKRIEDQKNSLGADGLSKKGKELQEAILKNETPIPDEILSSVPIPSTESIKFYDIRTHTTETEQHPKFQVDKLPFYTYLNNIKTNFVYMIATMDTSTIPVEHRPYIPLLLETILESPIERDGKLIPYETVVAELESDTVATSTRIGCESSSRFSCGSFNNTAMLILQMEESKYGKGVRWIKEILYKTVLTAERLKIIALKMINDVAQVKRQGGMMVKDLMKSLIYKKESNHYNVSLLRQHQFLTKLIERLNNDESVIDELESVRKILTTPENMTFYIAANVDKLSQDVYTPWNTLFLEEQFQNAKKKKLQVTPDTKVMNPWNEISMTGCVTSLSCIESLYLIQCCPAITSYESSDLAPLLVCLQYFTQLEGPMWRQIRGQGLSYHYNMYPMVNEGLLYLVLYQATNLVAAFKEAKNIIESHLAEEKWERLLFESAKTSLIYKIVQREKSVGDVVKETLLNYCKNVPLDYHRQMVNRISTVTIADINRVAPIYLKKLFNPDVAKTTVVCHPLKADEVVSGFKGFNMDLKLYNSLEESYLNSW